VRNVRFYRSLAICFVVLACLPIGSAKSTAAGGILSLAAPPFVARADTGSTTAPGGPADWLKGEAGLSAYFQAAQTIRLSTVQDLYRIVETATPEYLLGSVTVPGYPPAATVHLYIHMDGWVVAYHLHTDSIDKAVDWQRYTGEAAIPTKLQIVLSAVAAEIGHHSPNLGFYHFQYPEATHLTLSPVTKDGADAFEISVIGDHIDYETSWSAGGDISTLCTGCGYRQQLRSSD
jgi:hypothetical protein